MTYSKNYPVRLVGGRLALDFLNTADWRADGTMLNDKIKAFEDVHAWQVAAEIPDATLPKSISILHEFRGELRSLFWSGAPKQSVGLQQYLNDFRVRPDDVIEDLKQVPLLGLVAVSALSILSDPKERARLKMCPGNDCGWIFLDETKNARRKWCLMETCGNRAKATRSYTRKTKLQKA